MNTCKVPKEIVRVGVLLYPDLNAETTLNYWSNNLNISRDQFFKPTIIQGKHKIKRSNYGVCIVSVSDKRLKKKVLTWLDLFAKLF